MKTALFSIKDFEKPFLMIANQPYQHEFVFFESTLNEQTADLTAGFPAISCFLNDKLSAPVLDKLKKNGTRLIALRSTGFNHVDLPTAKQLGLTVTRVPAYSPHAIAEFAVGLILTLNRKIHRAYRLVKEQNFLLTHLLGFDLYKKTVGIIGTGKIGSHFARIMHGFGCRLLAFDPAPSTTCTQGGVRYGSLNVLYEQSDIISLHCPLNESTRYLINDETLTRIKPGVMLINTSRGGLIDSKALIKGLKTQVIGYLGLDVYEKEEELFFKDLSNAIIWDDIFTRLQAFPNVLITGHQAFLTKEALTNIAEGTCHTIAAFEQGRPIENITTYNNKPH